MYNNDDDKEDDAIRLQNYPLQNRGPCSETNPEVSGDEAATESEYEYTAANNTITRPSRPSFKIQLEVKRLLEGNDFEELRAILTSNYFFMSRKVVILPTVQFPHHC